MKPIDLYNRKPESIEYELGRLKGFYYDHVPEITEELWGLENMKISISVYKEFDFDGRRFWRLAAVFYDHKPVMVIQNAGREGDDHSEKFVTDRELYCKMISYIQELLIRNRSINFTDYDANEEIYNLDSFYGHTLDGEFECHN